ncbi:MAG: sulfatase, partial [Anaerolineae bacterium]|jgi:arylsulfatase A-like enzyme
MNEGRALNVVLLTIDCWRGDHLGVNGSGPSPTPHLDRLAAGGTLFEQAITPGGWTRPAMMALFSSVYASRHNGGSLRRLSPDLPVLAELLQARGYETAGFTANPVCGQSGDFGRGFDTFADLKTDNRQAQVWNRLRKVRGGHRLMRLLFDSLAVHRFLHLFRLRLDLPEVSASASHLTDEALAWLEGNPPSPFFLWVHYIDLHWPYRLSRRAPEPAEIVQAWRDRQTYRRVVKAQGRYNPGPGAAARWRALYREELTTVDEQIGRLVEHLKAGGHWAQTAIVVTSDHGEEFYEHGTWAHSWNQLFDEGVHVPLVFRVPGMPDGRIVQQQVSTLDLAPTVLDLAGDPPPDTMLGASLRPLLEGEATLASRPILTEMLGHRNSYRYRLAVRTGTHRYIHDMEQPQGSQLYDRRADPGERQNAYTLSHPAARRFDELRFAHMAPIVPDLLEQGEADALEGVEPEVADRLRAMGYLS